MVIGEARPACKNAHAKVTLYERGEELGGQLLIAGKPQRKRKLLWFRDYLVAQMKKLGVEVKLEVEVTSDLVGKVKPDAVVVATGAEPILLDIPIISKRALNAWDLLKGRSKPETERVAVVGGGIWLSEWPNTCSSQKIR
jgi:2-enoate reductase